MQFLIWNSKSVWSQLDFYNIYIFFKDSMLTKASFKNIKTVILLQFKITDFYINIF